MLLWLKVKVLWTLERTFSVLSEWCGDLSRRCAICPDCGRNRYTGRACKNPVSSHYGTDPETRTGE